MTVGMQFVSVCCTFKNPAVGIKVCQVGQLVPLGIKCIWYMNVMNMSTTLEIYPANDLLYILIPHFHHHTFLL